LKTKNLKLLALKNSQKVKKKYVGEFDFCIMKIVLVIFFMVYTGAAFGQDTTGVSTGGREAKRKSLSVYEKGFDTIWVSNPNRNVKITVDKFPEPPAADIGNKDFAAKILGCCDVVLKTLNVNGTPASLYIKYGDRYYSGTIAYREFLSPDDEVIDWRNKTDLPGPINETRAITSESPSLELQQIARGIGIMEGRTKDRFSTIADVREKLIFKLSDVVHDDDFYYFKFLLFNESKIDYKIELVEFLYRNSKNVGEYKRGEPLGDNKPQLVAAKKHGALIYALPKFTITSKWELVVTIIEKDGSRKLEITIPADKINEAVKM